MGKYEAQAEALQVLVDQKGWAAALKALEAMGASKRILTGTVEELMWKRVRFLTEGFHDDLIERGFEYIPGRSEDNRTFGTMRYYMWRDVVVRSSFEMAPAADGQEYFTVVDWDLKATVGRGGGGLQWTERNIDMDQMDVLMLRLEERVRQVSKEEAS